MSTSWPRAARPLALLLAILCTASVIAQTADDAAARSYQSASGLLNRGLYDLAAREYEAFLETHARHQQADEARYGLGICYYRLDRLADAATTLGPLARKPGFEYGAEVGTMLGQCHLRLGDAASAIETLRRVTIDHPRHELADDATALLVDALYADRRFAEIEQPARELAAQWPDSPRRERVELLASLAQITLGADDAAADRLDTLRRTFPQGAYIDQTELLLAQCLDRAGKTRRAVEQYTRVIDHGRGAYVGEAMYGSAALHYRLGRRAEAAAGVAAFLERFDEHRQRAAALLLRGRIEYDQGAFEDARRSFERMLEEPGAEPDAAAYWLAKCELASDDASAAAARLERAVEQYADSPLVAAMRYDHAVALLRAGEAAAAIDAFEAFRTLHPRHELAGEALYLIAATNHEQQAFETSRAHGQTFLSVHPDHARRQDVLFLNGENAFLAGLYREADDELSRFVETYPDSAFAPVALFRVGMARYKLGDWDGCTAPLRQTVDLVETHPEFVSAFLALGDLAFQRGVWPDAERSLEQYVTRAEADAPALDDALLKLGIARQRDGHPAQALAAFERLLENHADSPLAIHAQFERGQTLVELDRPDEAAAAFEQVVAGDEQTPFRIHALNHLGALALSAREYEAAADYYAEVARSADDDTLAAEASFQRGQALVARSEFGQASTVLARLIEEYPDTDRLAETRAHLATTLARQEKYDEALSTIETLEANGLDRLDDLMRANVLYEKAWSLRGLGRPEDAAKSYRTLLAEPPATPLALHARLELAELDIAADRRAAAAEQLRAVLSSTDPEPDAELLRETLYRLGTCEFARDAYEPTIETLERFIELAPDDDPLLSSAHLLCGESLYKLGSHRRAIAHLRHVDGETDQDYGASLLRLGECFAAVQDWPASERSFDRFLKRFAESDLWYQARFGLGWALENQDRRAKAIEAYRAVVERHQGPTAARAQFQIGECLFADRRFEQAVAELLKVDILYAYPEWSAAALYEAGRCFQELEDPVAARRHFELVQENHANTNWAKLAARQLSEMARPSLPGHRAGSADDDRQEG